MIGLDSMGHLYSDVSVAELYDFAVNKLGLKPEWNHYGRYFPHFDLTTARKKKQAKELGALYVDARNDIERYKTVRIMYAKWHNENAHLNYWYESAGLVGQKILRIDFKKLGIG